ncbi:MAG TPA: DUF4115 domain-containing protein, partial [Quisquiliibacterium sp.]|nr:DUF4115 domain-containing protein [Quisquiliibacterium sp.]
VPAPPGPSGSVIPAAGAGALVAAPATGSAAAVGTVSPSGGSAGDTAAGSAPLLRLSFERESWLEAKRDGKVIVSGVQSAGSSRELPIEAGTALVIGNAASVRAEFAGKPLDLTAHTRGSVARLSLP